MAGTSAGRYQPGAFPQRHAARPPGWGKLSRRAAPEVSIPATDGEITDIEQRIRTVESALIVLSIAAIAAADRFLAPSSSLGFLYLIPMSCSALTHRWPVFVLLLAACVWLRQSDTPVELQTWGRLALDWTLVAVFLAVVVPLRRLGRARTVSFRAAREQRDELVGEVEMAARVQQHLLDQHKPPASPLDVVARMHTAKVVGSDYYDFVPLDGQRVAVVVADVAGKGLPAALIMPAVRSRCGRWRSARPRSASCSWSSTASSSTTSLPPPTSRSSTASSTRRPGGWSMRTPATRPPST